MTNQLIIEKDETEKFHNVKFKKFFLLQLARQLIENERA